MLLVYDLGVLRHFGIDNYVWKLAIIEKYWWILPVALVLFYAKNVQIPPKHMVLRSFMELSTGINIYADKLIKFLLMGGFNVDIKEENMNIFFNMHKEFSCYENFPKLSCRDIFLNNSEETLKTKLYPQN